MVRITRVLAVAASICSLTPPWSPGSQAQERLATQRASISATGTAVSKHDRGWIEIFVTTEAAEPSAALAAHTQSLTDVLAKLTTKGFTGPSVDTGLLAIRPRYEVKRESGREIRGPILGYVVTKPVYVFFDDPDRAKAFISEFPLSGPVRIGNVGFYASNSETTRDSAIADAIKRAQKAGETAARAINRKIGAVSGVTLSVNDRGQGRPRVRTVQNWQYQPVNQSNPDELSNRLVLEPGEETLQQAVNIDVQLR